MKLSVLIPTTLDRASHLAVVLQAFKNHVDIHSSRFTMTKHGTANFLDGEEMQVVILMDSKENSVGAKRQALLELAEGDYVSFVDDDDMVTEHYLPEAFKGIGLGAEVCGLTGIITEDGKNPKKFVHSIMYSGWYEESNVYYRYINHLNVIKTKIARAVGYKDMKVGEDHDYSKRLQSSGMLAHEYWQPGKIVYHYNYISNK